MSTRFTGILVVALAAVFVLWNSLFIVTEKEQAIVLRFGEIRRVVEEPGLYFKLPFGFSGADTVQKLSDQTKRFDLDNIRVQVSGGKFYEVDAFLAYRIEDAALFRRTVSASVPQAEQRLRTRFDSALRTVYGQRGFEAALSEERGEMMQQVAEQIRPDAASLGLKLLDVRIRRTDLTQEVSQQTYERMKAERLAEAELLRARGQVSARTIRAGADREVVETVAGARRDAEILQGQGEAERNGIFATAFGANEEFFEFYRSMKAYETALQNTGTTMVLSPNSEFFRYFNEPGAPVASNGAPAAPATPSAAPAAEAAPAPEASEPTTTGAVEPAPAAVPAETPPASADLSPAPATTTP
ncbi:MULTISPECIES: protease modulator HflC [unclassified Aureimonas]|uniref:protease modulator HflC n=1 Tax=unclassified Aureimonas TaxID=2615206 RepID=UPI0006F5F617|nr:MULTISPECIES: protease modulator HflC [unclassified Aureimonas]KQT52871.1 protease modulator HflC [Aureimonas sp. Leaf427]KQT80330.1 protease modulator HflC [Aureimonas sp. Leaf460]